MEVLNQFAAEQPQFGPVIRGFAKSIHKQAPTDDEIRETMNWLKGIVNYIEGSSDDMGEVVTSNAG